jgi:hypothetical protein
LMLPTHFDIAMLEVITPTLCSYLKRNFLLDLSQSWPGVSVTNILADKSLVFHYIMRGLDKWILSLLLAWECLGF